VFCFVELYVKPGKGAHKQAHHIPVKGAAAPHRSRLVEKKVKHMSGMPIKHCKHKPSNVYIMGNEKFMPDEGDRPALDFL
jgi:hypothetical protein